MAGPWEKYSAAPAAAPAGPWAKYSAPATPAAAPLYVPAPDGGEIRVTDDNRAQIEAQQNAEAEARATEQASFDATRTLPTRIRDTATFAASVPVRAVTRGEYGIGDVFGLASQTAGKNALLSEANFARANQTGLEAAASAGSVAAGIPVLATMGAVPGQVLRTGAAAVRQLPGEANRLLRDTSGAMKIAPGQQHPYLAALEARQPAALDAALGQMSKAELQSVAANLGINVGEKATGAQIAKQIGDRYITDLRQSQRVGQIGEIMGPTGPADAAAAESAMTGVTEQFRSALGAQAAPRALSVKSMGATRIQQQTAAPAPPGAPPPVNPPAAAAGAPPPGGQPPSNPLIAGARLPSRLETEAAGARQGVTIPRMVVGSETNADVAAALAGIPYSGAPVKMAFDRGLRELGEARDVAMNKLGAPGTERAGQGVKDSVLNWVRKQSKDDLGELYEPAFAKVDPNVTRDLMATRGIVDKLKTEMQASTSQASAPAVKLLDEALSRPGGLSARGLMELRSDIGRRIDAARTVPDPSEAAFKRIYPALTNDLRETLKAAGGESSLRAWDMATREAKIVAGKRKRLAKIVGTNEDALSGEKVLERARSLADIKGGNQRGLDLIMETIGPNERGNLGAELVSRLGTNPKNGLFSADRFLSDYGKMSDAGKAALFGDAKASLDDIATISKRFSDLGGRFNKSNTGKVTAMLKLLSNPTAVLANVATAAVNPIGALTIGGQLGGMAAGRRLAWSLAQPSTAKKASSMVRAFYGAESAVGKGAELVARNEERLAKSTRAYATALAQQGGMNADEVEAALKAHIEKIRKGQTDQ